MKYKVTDRDLDRLVHSLKEEMDDRMFDSRVAQKNGNLAKAIMLKSESIAMRTAIDIVNTWRGDLKNEGK